MRYAYWRKPDSTLYAGDDERFAPDALLREIGTRATVDGAGGISWSLGSFYQELDATTSSSLAICQPDGTLLNESDTLRLVRDAIHELIKKSGGGKPISPRALRLLVQKKADTFFKLPKLQRVLVTGLSVKNCPLFPIDVFGTRIEVANREKFPIPARLIKYKGYLSEHLNASTYQVVSVTTESSSIFQAYDTAIEAINCLRAIWNMIATWGSMLWGSSPVPQRRWIGEIHTAPIQTFHAADGTPIEDVYWYEPDYVADAPLFSPRNGWDDFDKRRVELFAAASVSPIKDEVKKLLSRYAVALDQSNGDVALIMLWSLLERVTDTVGARYDDTIDRAIWLFNDRDVCKQALDQVRIHRNQYVHSAISSARRDQLSRVLKNIVDDHLITVIENPFGASSLKEYAAFLSLPHNVERLRALKRMYQRAIHFQATVHTP